MDKMELQRLFSIAINREVEAHQFYKNVAQRVENEEVKKVFLELAEQEMSHKELLEKYQYDPTLEMKFEAPDIDYKVAEATELPKLSIDMKPADAIALAMKKEQQAMEFYLALAKGTKDEGLKKAFKTLAHMELEHKTRLEIVFVEIGYPEVF
ncbi:MAG: ferritin family protein [Pseudomonadota bacterium]